MPVIFNSDERGPELYRIFSPKPGKRMFARIGSDKGYHLTTEMHYQTANNNYIPCQHEDCRLCPLPSRTVTYCPSLLSDDGQNWRAKVLIVTTSWMDLLRQPLDKWIFQVTRGPEKNSPVAWVLRSEVPAGTEPFHGFDIAPSLYRAWGIKYKPNDV